MVTYSQLQTEDAYNDEFRTPELIQFCNDIADDLGIPRANVGSKGDNAHLNGAHRSQRWILNSRFCTNRTYAVWPGLAADRMDALAGIDITPATRQQMLEISQRVDYASRQGWLEPLHEWFGNTNNDTRVDGWNNLENRVASSDSSHLWHWHGTINRWYLRDAGFFRRLRNAMMNRPLDQGTAPAAPTIVVGGRNMMLGKIAANPAVFQSWDGRTRQQVQPDQGDTLPALAAAGFNVVNFNSEADITALMGPVGPRHDPNAVVSEAQIDQISEEAAAAVVARDDNPLGEADIPAIAEGVREALRSGVGTGV